MYELFLCGDGYVVVRITGDEDVVLLRVLHLYPHTALNPQGIGRCKPDRQLFRVNEHFCSGTRRLRLLVPPQVMYISDWVLEDLQEDKQVINRSAPGPASDLTRYSTFFL